MINTEYKKEYPQDTPIFSDGDPADCAHNLGMNVISEGIQIADVYKVLRDFKSDYAQGYLYTRPVPEAGFMKLLKNGLSQNVPDEIEIRPAKNI